MMGREPMKHAAGEAGGEHPGDVAVRQAPDFGLLPAIPEVFDGAWFDK